MKKGWAGTLWLFRSRLSVSLQYCPSWRRGGLAVWDNGGRASNEVLDLNWVVWKLTGSITFWHLGPLAVLTRYIPDGRQRRGYSLGWFAMGREDD